jgi:tryptophan halogenase
MEEIQDVTVVGGGDVGLLTALSLRNQNPDLDIRIVDDFDGSGTDVGKSTFQRIVVILHEVLDVDPKRFFEEVKPVFKLSVYFRDWSDCDEFHLPFDLVESLPDGFDQKSAERFYYLYDEIYPSTEFRTSNEEMVVRRKTPFTLDAQGSLDRFKPYAYQFDTGRFNSFFRDLCEERGIELVDDRITAVHTDGPGRIDRVESEDDVYEADLYVDASGFNRLLRRELDNSFKEFEFPLDSGFNTKVERDLSEVVPATVVETGDHGWFWQIDTYDHRDFGYVYSSEHVSDEVARQEFLDYWDIDEAEADEMRKYEFDSGYIENAWTGNCVAIGNAGGFVEPLQSTALTANAGIATTLSALLAAHNRNNHPGIRKTFNGFVQNIWEDIYDFIFVHYKFSNGDTEFWDAMQSLEGTPRVQQIIEEFNENGIIAAIPSSPSLTPTNTTITSAEHGEDVVWNLDFPLFPLQTYFWMMRKLGAESDFYEDNEFEVSDAVKESQQAFFEDQMAEVDVGLSTEEFYQLL